LLPRTKGAEDFSQARLPFVGQGFQSLYCIGLTKSFHAK
jgi:hypothetical protein